jgi:uncharacterized iron-regulated protein
MNFKAIILTLIIWSATMTAQKSYALKFLDSELRQIEYSAIVKAASRADFVFFGETHNSKLAHSIEIQLAADLYAAVKDRLIMGAEMFESDNQLIIDEYLAGYFDDSKFEADARLWPNYKTDYKPLLQFAKEKKLRFIATNIPRRYASMVGRGGFVALDVLSAQAKSYIADLPPKFDPENTTYKTMIKGMANMTHNGLDPLSLAKAQAIKDATMAKFIFKNYSKGKLFYHINGSYHSYNREGIIWYLKDYDKKMKVYSITIVEDEQYSQNPDSYKGKADILIILPKDSPKSY